MGTDEHGPPFRVLCVDDNRDVADSTALLMRTVGFEARACYDGASALAAVKEFGPSVLLIDLQMPGMDGDELVARLLAEGLDGHVLLVAVTAMGSEECRKRIAGAGFHHHLVKPVDPHQLLGLVDAQFKRWEEASRLHTSARVEEPG